MNLRHHLTSVPPGTFIFAPLTEYLVASYGWKNAMLILAAVLCSCSFFGVLFRPLEPVRTPKRQPKYVRPRRQRSAEHSTGGAGQLTR